ncbi:MAG: HEAT repeat domain-containing protein [Thermodesulfobacteriota bacterium]
MEKDVSDDEMVKVIADFLEQGLADNIISMFKADSSYYPLIGQVLRDERFAVRLGVNVLFEELVAQGVSEVALAVEPLVELLDPQTPAYVRGEAAGVLGIIASASALAALKPLVDDEDPQVAEIARDYV